MSRYDASPYEVVAMNRYGSHREVTSKAPSFRTAKFRTVVYDVEEEGAGEVMASGLDSMHTLANIHLGGPENWWAVADANPHIRYPLDIKMGDVIKIP